jgi:D-glycero-alpha-D-manno-heptose 1-phosphate guanylyltransferase
MTTQKTTINEAIILAGGKGTRLQSVVNDLPKPMAPVNGKPFLWHLLSYLTQQGVSRFILSVGYKHRAIIDYFGNSFNNAEIEYAIEQEPLGTGGGIKLAVSKVKSNQFWVINGDTFVRLSLAKYQQHCPTYNLNLALVKLTDFDRYGVVETINNRVSAFKEKEFHKEGYINAGIYLMTKKFTEEYFPEKNKFSFEQDILEKYVNTISIGFYKTEAQFIDIGIPEDYYKAQFIFSDKLNKDKFWALPENTTIFLDRDGVINKRKPGGYIKSVEEFEFITGAKEAIAKMSNYFARIIVVTNQQGVGKGLMTEKDIEAVNTYMQTEIERAGGKLDAIYSCFDLKNKENNCRKPSPQLAYRAQKDFPEINFKQSVIIGDSISDMEFGKNLGMKTILIPDKEEEQNEYPKIEVDWRIYSLQDLV